MKIRINAINLLVAIVIFFFMGCASAYKPAELDAKTGIFPSSVEKETANRPVDPKLEKIITDEDLDQFVHTYYLHPNPELIPQAINYLNSRRILDQEYSKLPLLAFFSKIFADNPDLIPEWKRVIEMQNQNTKEILKRAINNKPEQLFSEMETGPALNDMYWGAFFASGDFVYLNKLINNLKYLNERKDKNLYFAAASAKWSLCSNAKVHFKVKMAMEAVKVGDVPELRKVARDILNMEPQQIEEETRDVIKQQKDKGVW